MGGGSSQDGNTPAKTAAQAAATPFFGVFGAYSRARDPWQTPEVRAYNRYFYRKTLEYLDSRGACSGCQYRVRPFWQQHQCPTHEGRCCDSSLAAAPVLISSPEEETVVAREASQRSAFWCEFCDTALQ